jgi:hypothetical protein
MDQQDHHPHTSSSQIEFLATVHIPSIKAEIHHDHVIARQSEGRLSATEPKPDSWWRSATSLRRTDLTQNTLQIASLSSAICKRRRVQ